MRHPVRFLTLLTLFAGATTSALAATWEVPGDFATIQEAIDSPSVEDGDEIVVASGNRAGALVDKSVSIVGGAGAVIDDGPAHPSGFIQGFRMLAGSDGAAISHFTFVVDFPVMTGAVVTGVTLSNNDVLNALQGFSAWRGTDWVITRNRFVDLRTACGGGIAILLGDFSDVGVSGNEVSFNRIEGTLQVAPGDCGGYSGTGIVVFSDHRFGRVGGEVHDNLVTHNHVRLVSDTPEVVDVIAIELTDTRDDDTLGCLEVHDNTVVHNVLRHTERGIELTPTNLDECNTVDKNVLWSGGGNPFMD